MDEALQQLIGVLGVIMNAAVVSIFGYGGYIFLTGSKFSVETYALIVALLSATVVGLVYFLKWYRPDLLNTAEALERQV